MLSNLYLYDGPVYKFDLIVTRKYRAYTYAVSEKQARSNFTHQYKKENGFAPGARINLPGKIELLVGKEN